MRPAIASLKGNTVGRFELLLLVPLASPTQLSAAHLKLVSSDEPPDESGQTDE